MSNPDAGCDHTHILTETKVVYMPDIHQRQAEIRLPCQDCGLVFHFKGLPMGLNLHGAAVSVDGTEGRFALGEGPLPIGKSGRATFTLGKEEGH